jgi:hypothetical protein
MIPLGSSISRGQRSLLWLLVSLLLIAAFFQAAPQAETPYDPDAASPAGLLALRLWLDEMGYQVERLESPFDERHAPDLLFVFPNQRPYSAQVVAQMGAWVQAGGVLVLIGPSDRALVEEFGVSQRSSMVWVSDVRQVQPILPDRPARYAWAGFAQGLYLNEAPGALPVLAIGSERASAAVQQVGEGVVWYVDTLHDFTNETLRDPNQAALLPALLRLTPAGGVVMLDVYHLSPPPADAQAITSLQDWLYRTRWGWAFLLSCGALLAYLALQGVRLGPPLADQSLRRNREAAEYVEAMAGLYQRSRQHATIAQHLARRLKARVGHALRISPDLPNDQFLHALEQGDSHFSEGQVASCRELLARLSRPVNEIELTRIAADADTLLAEMGLERSFKQSNHP